MLAYAQPGLAGVIGALYLVAGGTVAWRLSQRETSPAALLGAVVAWPVFLPLLGAPPRRKSLPGPLAPRIETVFRGLAVTLADPAVAEVPWEANLEGLREALYRSDERLGLVDRLLEETAAGEAGPVREARRRAEEEIERVLDEVVQLRLQIGLAALAGDNGSVRDRLGELLLRVRALDEVTRIHG